LRLFAFVRLFAFASTFQEFNIISRMNKGYGHTGALRQRERASSAYFMQ
jgi:hypothetical protein